jgi:PAS domain S-box-containing protein
VKQYIEKIEHDLQERLKELECLYRISSILESEGPLGDLLLAAAEALRHAMQYPDRAVTCIRLDGAEYRTGPCPGPDAPSLLKADITIGETERGTVSVAYAGEQPFLNEEAALLREVGRMLAKAIERRELVEELNKDVGTLEARVRQKTSELELSRRHFEDLFMYAPDGVVISRPNGDIVKANPTFYRMLQYPEDGSVALNFVRDKLYQDISRVRPFVYGKLDAEGFLEGFELTLLDSEGNPVPVIGSYIYIDIDGERCVESVYKDIRQRKAMERALIEQNENLEKIVGQRTADLEKRTDQLMKKNRELGRLTRECRESRERLQTLFHAITDTVVMIDPGFNILTSNTPRVAPPGKCYEKVFGRAEPCDDCPGVLVLRSRVPVSCERRMGEAYYRLQTYPMLSDDREATGMIEFSRDITTEKNIELQLMQTDKLASLGQLVSGVAHEINNPNTFIRGNIAIIQEALADILPILDTVAAARGDLRIARLTYDVFRSNIPILVEDMLQGSNRIKGIVDGLREFARRDDGVLDETVDLNAVVDNCLRLVQNQIKRTARVTFEPEEALPAVEGNFQKLEQVVVNILINASHAIDKDKGVIAISTRHDAERREVILLIGDNGTGMDERTRRQIFDPFFTTKRTQGGTGLGLSIAHRIIREHRGRIDVESQPGVGTTFFIHLPVAERSPA